MRGGKWSVDSESSWSEFTAGLEVEIKDDGKGLEVMRFLQRQTLSHHNR